MRSSLPWCSAALLTGTPIDVGGDAGSTAPASRRTRAVSRFPVSGPLDRMSEKKPPDGDIRCPHCKIVVLKKERRDVNADRLGAPEFCPRCGERFEPYRGFSPPIPGLGDRQT